MKKALIFGSTGAVGKVLLNLLLQDEDYCEVIAVTRSPLPKSHKKLRNIIGDYTSAKSSTTHILSNDVFIALGSPDQTIERYYPVLAAQIGESSGATAIFAVTAVGANSNSRLSYTRLKGEIENDIAALNYESTNVFRPSMIFAKRKHYRPMERTMTSVWKFLSPLFIGPLKKYRGIEASEIAVAMLMAAKQHRPGFNAFEYQEMKERLIHKSKS